MRRSVIRDSFQGRKKPHCFLWQGKWYVQYSIFPWNNIVREAMFLTQEATKNFLLCTSNPSDIITQKVGPLQ